MQCCLKLLPLPLPLLLLALLRTPTCTQQGRPLPRPVSGDGAAAGVWVVGLSKESEADRAGIQQGDQLLQVMRGLIVYRFDCVQV
jgi:hypothetical protein